MRIFLKKLKKIFLILLIVGSIERFCRLQTDGFRMKRRKVLIQLRQSSLSMRKLQKCLKDLFLFLGSGVQSYAFVSADGQTVLKLFKHYHIGPSNDLTISWPKQVKRWCTCISMQRSKRIKAIYDSHRIAFATLREETGLLHLQLDPCLGPTVILYDKIGIRHEIDLSHTPFVLQNCATPIFTSLQEELKNGQLTRAKTKIDSLLVLIKNRRSKGILGSDPVLYRNFGFIDTQAIEIDAGSFTQDFLRVSPFILRKELYLVTCGLQEWLAKHSPELAEYLLQKILYEMP